MDPFGEDSSIFREGLWTSVSFWEWFFFGRSRRSGNPRGGSFCGELFEHAEGSANPSGALCGGSFYGRFFERARGIVNPNGALCRRSFVRSGGILNPNGSFCGRILGRLEEVVHPNVDPSGEDLSSGNVNPTGFFRVIRVKDSSIVWEGL